MSGEAKWEAIRSLNDRRRVAYWRLTTDPDDRMASLGAVRRYEAGDDCIEGWYRARTYAWSEGFMGGEVLGFFPTKREAMRAVEVAVEHAQGRDSASRVTERFFR